MMALNLKVSPFHITPPLGYPTVTDWGSETEHAFLNFVLIDCVREHPAYRRFSC